MAGRHGKSVFGTNKRIRLGIWGLGRGMSFYKTCAAMNFDVVAGCDFNEHMRTNFLNANPGAFATDDAEKFLAYDIDAVLLATFCPSHADDAIRCLNAGKHVLSEVTSFHTMAEGVRLVEAVAKSGLVYNLAENYPFTKPNMYLAAKWKEGLFGDLMYAEYEYIHECRSLCYTYIDGLPVQPGWTVHNWRSWLNFHYYNTHSLGPMMIITGTRPVRVSALPGHQRLAGYLMDAKDGMGGITPSLINMSNGAVVRNLMGATTNDSHLQRLWGTKGAAEINNGLWLRLGGSGGSPKMQVEPEWPMLGEFASTMGHGGGDFWVLYYFARQILTGESAPFDIYAAADCTIPGLLAFRSSQEGGKPFDVPDFRKRKERDHYRHDNYAQPRYDAKKGCFPVKADKKLTGEFSTVIKALIDHAVRSRSYFDWTSVIGETKEPGKVLEIACALAANYPEMITVMGKARKLADAYPGSDGARVLEEMLALGEEKRVTGTGFLSALKRRMSVLGRKYHIQHV